ncbi:MAG: hypothetical protein MI892_04120, partial [Desulfobacterales bacterium]|nr:hypothetical protein [Desulfobacterales bacterium]
GFLSPYVEQALNSGHRSFKLAFDDTTLTWAGWERVIELRVTNVRAVGQDDATIAKIPELSLALSGDALLRGELAPKYVELLGPDIRVRKSSSGNVDFALATNVDGDVGGRVASGLIGWLLKSPESDSPMSHLDTVRITGATVTYQDDATGGAWQIPVGHVRLDRAAHGLLGEGSLLIDAGGRIADIAVTGSYHQGAEKLDITATFADIAPDAFSKLTPELAILDGADIPLSGTLVLGVGLNGNVDTVGFNVRGAAGTLQLPSPIGKTVDVETLTARGLFDGDAKSIVLDEVKVDFADKTAIQIPAPISHTYIVDSIAGRGAFDGAVNELSFNDVAISLDGPAVRVSGTLPIANPNGGSIKFSGELIDVPVDRLADYWPATMGEDAWSWVTRNLAGGTMKRAQADVVATIDETGAVNVDSLVGTMSAEGVDVTY